jgi:hypothetical protein
LNRARQASEIFQVLKAVSKTDLESLKRILWIKSFNELQDVNIFSLKYQELFTGLGA